MGKVKTRERQCGTRYTALYEWTPGKFRSAGTFDTYKKADEAWRAEEALIRRGRGPHTDPQRGAMKFAAFAEHEWMPSLTLRKKSGSIRDYKSRYNNYLRPFFGEFKLNEIDAPLIRRWMLDLQARGVDDPSEPLTVLSGILTLAERDGRIHGNPVPSMREKPREKPDRRSSITVAEFKAIYDALPGPYARLAVLVLIETGMRQGEAFELRGRDLHLNKRDPFIRVERNVVNLGAEYTEDGGCFLVQDTTKGYTDRQISITPLLSMSLRDHLTSHGIGPDDLVFPIALMETEVPTKRPRHKIPVSVVGMPTLAPFVNARGTKYEHGTARAYSNGGCRCEWCRSAHAEKARARRAGKPRTNKTTRKQVAKNTTGHTSLQWFRRYVWHPAVERAGIGKHVVPHELRHSHLTWLVENGEDIYKVQRRAGHASIRTTEKYLHRSNVVETSASNLMGSLLNS